MESLRIKSVKAKILDAAFKRFRKKGFHGSGLNEILSDAGAGKSQLYHYFDNKESLARECLKAYAEKILRETALFMNEVESLDEFEKMIDGSLKMSHTSGELAGCFVGSFCAELALTEEVIRVEICHIFERWRNIFSKGLTRLQARGLLKSDADTDAIAEHFLISTQGAFLLAKAYKNPNIIKTSLAESIQYIKSYAT